MTNNDDMLEQAIDQAKSDEALSDIDIGYTKECIEDQIENLLDTSSKKNYLKKLEEQMQKDDIDLDYVASIRDNLYMWIIDLIAEKFSFTVDKNGVDNIAAFAKTLYKFFILQYTDNIVYFIEMAILENQKAIISELQDHDGINNRHIEGVSSKISLILNNIGDVIEVLNGMELTFDDFVDYIDKHEDSKSSVIKMKDYIDSCMSDTDNIIEKIMKSLVNEEDGFAGIYTDLQRNIYNRFSKE